MNDILFMILQVVVSAAVAAISRYVIPLVISELRQSKHEYAAEIVMMAVRAAEQMIAAPGSGERKYAMAFDIIKASGIKMTDEQIQLLIESAVQTMNAEKGAVDNA